EDKVKDVNAGETISVTAVYNGNDKDNYEKTSVTVNVTGTDCKHDGGTTVKNEVAATCGKAGYTGDTHCSICNAVIETGKVIEATGNHNWNDGALQGGKMVYTCTVCGATTEQPGAVIVRLLDTEFVYDGTPKTPEVAVKSGTATLIKDRDYTVTYRNNTDAGDMNAGALAPAVIVTCKGSYEGTFEKTFTIKKAAEPKSGKPGSTMNVSKDFEKVSDIKDLPDGWVWDPGDADKTLGEQPIKATAIYNKDDRKNYETVSVEVSITKSSDCSHPFGNVETKNSKSATCTGKGYTGDRYCTNCQTTVQSGTEIPALGHSWSSWKVTKQPTATAKGMKVR
ncbi:MAG: hypothetical protein K2I10_12955, partial [Lachnospiraceae bacterium]|nr:hypothetical protein [Lachnospiraceae bacterium]